MIRLYADGEEIRSQEVSAQTGWKYEFAGLYKYDQGKEIEYTIGEDLVPDYTAAYSEPEETENGFSVDVTNTLATEIITVSGTKVWDDFENESGTRPEEITIRLYADGTEIAQSVLSENAQTVTPVSGTVGGPESAGAAASKSQRPCRRYG